MDSAYIVKRKIPDSEVQFAANNAALAMAAVCQVARADSGVSREEGDRLIKEQMLAELCQLSRRLGLAPDAAVAELLRALSILSGGLLAENALLADMSVADLIEIRQMELRYGGPEGGEQRSK
ncbi:hypothetical protein ACIQOW_32535 [Kitasatospora sp. NPDC091335]|uniref:hypothetical protein n=1 Tax=Kitasatospora sp. NPDC091335 TaxID=3364085 RepID=UPI0038304355